MKIWEISTSITNVPKWYNGFLFLTYCYQWGWNVNIVSNAKVTTDFTIWNLQIPIIIFCSKICLENTVRRDGVVGWDPFWGRWSLSEGGGPGGE